MPKRSTIDEKDLRSQARDFDNFMRSTVWYDLRNLVEDRLKILQGRFINAQSAEEIRNLQGQVTAWTEVLGLPAHLKQCADMETENDKPNEDE